jgi:sugar O-acyltransferase (sialic acid O-acetyltransferase NeuD family)
MRERKLLLYGFGGHARSVGDVALRAGYTSLVFVDAQARVGETFCGHPVVAEFSKVQGEWYEAIATSGNAELREQQCAQLQSLGFELTSIVSPLGSVARNAEIGEGSFVGHHAHVGPAAQIGRGAIVNTGAVVEHDALVGEFAHVSVNAALAGRACLGRFSMLGAGATVIDGVRVGDHATVGAGAVVTSDIRLPGVYAGVPCRPL